MVNANNTRKHCRMRSEILRLLAKLPGRWGGMALAEALCSDTKSVYGGRNPYKLHSTVNGALLRLVELGMLERVEETTEIGRKRFTYAITPKGRVAAKEMGKCKIQTPDA